MLNDRAEQILARFPGPVTVRPVLTLSVGAFIAGSTLFSIVCLWGAWHYWTQKGSGSSTWGLGFCAALFAFFAAGSAYMLRTNTMTLDREGFELVFPPRKKRYRWKDVSAFDRQYWSRGSYVVGFDDETRKGGGIFAAVDRAIGFRNTALFEDYGLGEKQLAELLNHWRDRALALGDGARSGRDLR